MYLPPRFPRGHLDSCHFLQGDPWIFVEEREKIIYIVPMFFVFLPLMFRFFQVYEML